MLLCRHVVPALWGVCLLPASYPSVGHHCQPLSTNQKGPKVRLAASHFGHVHQQVSQPETGRPPLPKLI